MSELLALTGALAFIVFKYRSGKAVSNTALYSVLYKYILYFAQGSYTSYDGSFKCVLVALPQ